MASGRLVITIEGTALSFEEKVLIQHSNTAGVILFKANYQSKPQIRALIQAMRHLKPDLLIFIDHEGGAVWRFEEDFTKLPPMKKYGQLFDHDPDQALRQAKADAFTMASELLSCGIDISLTPILDLDGPSCIIGGKHRAFHADPLVVSKVANSFIDGMLQAGMPATGKHFPDHGSCIEDSHIDKPTDKRTFASLQNSMQPYRDLIAQGKLGLVMPAHIVYPALDPDYPAGFSKAWLDYLRQELGFQGVIISDCLSMKGAEIGTYLERAQRAIEAGCDLLILCHQKPSLVLELLNALPPTNLDSSQRIAQLKKTHLA